MKVLIYLRNRGFALFMALVMCLSLLPAQALAAEIDGGEWRKLTSPTGSGNKKLIVELLQKYDPYYGCSLCGGEWRTHLCHAER